MKHFDLRKVMKQHLEKTSSLLDKVLSEYEEAVEKSNRSNYSEDRTKRAEEVATLVATQGSLITLALDYDFYELEQSGEFEGEMATLEFESDREELSGTVISIIDGGKSEDPVEDEEGDEDPPVVF